jgi:hypothetical protein
MPTRTLQKETPKKAKATTSSGKGNALQRPVQPSEALAGLWQGSWRNPHTTAADEIAGRVCCTDRAVGVQG